METSIFKKQQSERLIFSGVFLFLLGLITGFLIPLLANPRMGLSSHIEGVLNGMFLVVLGLIWDRIDLSKKWLSATYWLALYGTFANWFGILTAAFFNAGKMLTVAANGQEGHPAAEAAVNFFLITLSIAMVVICITVLIGLKRSMPGKTDN
jgi:(hydroxyamino)benzene mutase